MLRIDGVLFDSTNYFDRGTVEQGSVFFDSTNQSVSFASDSTVIPANYLKRRLQNLLSTGVLDGGELSSDGTNIIVQAGHGVITNNYSNTLNPTSIEVSWPDQTTTTPYFNTHATSYLAINDQGNLQIKVEEESDHRDYIPLGVAGHYSKFQIDYVIQSQHVAYDPASNFFDYIESFGVFNIYGNIYTPDGTDFPMGLDKNAGKSYGLGLNYENNKKIPNIISDATNHPVSFLYSWLDGTSWVGGSNRTTIDASTYNPIAAGSGDLTSVPDGSWSAQTLFYFPQTGSTIIQHSQYIYENKENARAGVNDSIEISDSNTSSVFRGWLLVKSDATDLSDLDQAEIITSGKFGITNIIGGTYSGGETNTGANIGLDGVGPFYQKNGAVFQFRNTAAGSNKISITNNNTNKTIDVDVVPSNINLDDLGDTNVSTPTDGDVLTWDNANSEWVDEQPTTGGGYEGDYSESNAESSTTSTTYQQKNTLSYNVPVETTYEVIGTALFSANAGNREVYIRMQVDNTTTKGEMITDMDDADYGDGAWKIYSKHFVVTLTTGVHTIDMDYHTEAASMTAYIKESVITIRRIG